MLEDLGVHIVEAAWLSTGALWVAEADTLLIHPDASPRCWAAAADAVLMPCD